jgi:hypothetical protein
LRKDAPKKCVVNGVTKYEGLFSCIKSKVIFEKGQKYTLTFSLT